MLLAGGSFTRTTSLFLYRYGDHRDLHSFPTRRSSDLQHFDTDNLVASGEIERDVLCHPHHLTLEVAFQQTDVERDRKSTRLNSSHGSISYAVFCLKK